MKNIFYYTYFYLHLYSLYCYFYLYYIFSFILENYAKKCLNYFNQNKFWKTSKKSVKENPDCKIGEK